MKAYKLSLQLTGKARPRFNPNTGLAYHDKKYTKWLKRVSDRIKKVDNRPLNYFYCLVFDIHLKNRRIIDADNIVGAFLDAVVISGIIPGDSCKHLKRFWVSANVDSKEFLTMYVCRSLREFLAVLGKLESEPDLIYFANSKKDKKVA